MQDSALPALLVFNNPDDSCHQSLMLNYDATVLNSTPTSGKTAPVPVQSRKSRSSLGTWGTPNESVGEAQMDELQRMYDMRTWDMYIRITEARKNKPQPTMIPHQQQQHLPLRSAKDDYDHFITGVEPMDSPDHPADASQSEEMIFGDLE